MMNSLFALCYTDRTSNFGCPCSLGDDPVKPVPSFCENGLAINRFAKPLGQIACMRAEIRMMNGISIRMAHA
ncbi:MAG: hypothetical protein ACRERS_06375 [Methylococcales bacterium]